MNGMSNRGRAWERFVIFAKKYYWEVLTEEERRHITYPYFADLVAKEYFEDYDEEYKITYRNKIYRYLKAYLNNHPNGKLEKDRTYNSINAITDLFEIDYKKDKLKETLGIRYSYCNWSQEIETPEKKKIYFVMLECGQDKADDVHAVVAECFDHLISNLFFSYKGLLITFNLESNMREFLIYIKK